MVVSLVYWPPRRRSNRTGSRMAPKPFLSDSQWGSSGIFVARNHVTHAHVAGEGAACSDQP